MGGSLSGRARLGSAAIAVALAALFGAGAAAAATPPSAGTGPVTAVAPTTATVAGTVNPNGTATTWYVEYGTTTGYGSKTASASAGSGSSTIAVSADLTGLKPGTTYHYRVTATSTAGTGHGDDGLLTTAGAPVVVTGSADGISTTAATLNGTVDPNGRATTWFFEYGTSTSYASKTSVRSAGSGTSPVAASASITGLSTGKLYHFRLVATSDAGTTNGVDQTFVPTSAPSVTTKAASSIGDTSAKLNGSVVPNGQATTAFFEYGTTTSYGSKTSSKSVGSGTGSTNVSDSISGLHPGTVYHYRLVATSGPGTGTGSDVAFTTSGPPIPTTGAASGITGSGATLTGSVDPAGHSTSWYFQYGTTTAYGSMTSTGSVGSSSGAHPVSAAIGGLTPGTVYHARLVASSSAGTVTGSDVSFSTAGPAITLSASALAVTYRDALTLSGTLANKQTNATVTVFSQRLGAGSFAAIATVLTDAGGTWQLTVRPSIHTVYKALWNGQSSSAVTVGVRPAVTLRARTGARFSVHVGAGRYFRGRVVQLQRRLEDGRWLTIARGHLGAGSTVVFHPALRRGTTTLRAAISVNQSGLGYLAGFSATIRHRRA